jgi:hypothetical protein
MCEFFSRIVTQKKKRMRYAIAFAVFIKLEAHKNTHFALENLEYASLCSNANGTFVFISFSGELKAPFRCKIVYLFKSIGGIVSGYDLDDSFFKKYQVFALWSNNILYPYLGAGGQGILEFILAGFVYSLSGEL